MIDTIVLRLHNLEKNRIILNYLNNYTKEGYETEEGHFFASDLDEIHRRKIKDPIVIMETLRFKNRKERKGGFILKTKMGKQMNQSHHYMFTYFVNYSKDYIEFNFSIPKFKYGTNIFLFVRHQTEKGFRYYDATSLEHNIKESYDLFIQFLTRFFHWEIPMGKVDPIDVEINRIDLCFNQVFNSKSDALLYLEYQKRLNKKYARDENGVMRGYETSLMYVTKRYSAKIYHKGTEYEKHDRKQHLKFNKEKRMQYFKIDQLQAFSDKTLRYELTLRNPFLNYLHKQTLFRKKCSIWQNLFKRYKLAEIILQRNDRIAKKAATFKTNEERVKYLEKHHWMPPEPKLKEAHKMVSKVISRTRHFKLWTDAKSNLFNIMTVPYEEDNVFFSKELMNLCFKKLLEFVNEFQIKELPSVEIVKTKILNFNVSHPAKKLPLSEMMIFYSHLIKYGSFKDASKFCNYSRATLFRYMVRFKQIGIDDKSIRPLEKEYGIPKAPLDLRDYHYYINDNQLLRGIKICEASVII